MRKVVLLGEIPSCPGGQRQQAPDQENFETLTAIKKPLRIMIRVYVPDLRYSWYISTTTTT